MAFRNYYLGWKNKGETFYSKQELLDDIKSDKELCDEIKSGGNNYTIIKENTSSRVFQKAIIENCKIKLVTLYREKMIDGDYGN